MLVNIAEGRTYDMPLGFNVPCSKTWTLHGKSDWQDQVTNWQVDGNQANDPYLWPWLREPILVTGYEMLKVEGGPTLWFMLGSGIVPDIFLKLGPNEDHARRDFPDNQAHPWPSKEEADRRRELGDINALALHGACATHPKPQAPRTWYQCLWSEPPSAWRQCFGAEPKVDPIPITLHVTIYYVSPQLSYPGL